MGLGWLKHVPDAIGLGLGLADTALTSTNQFLAMMKNWGLQEEAYGLTQDVGRMQTEAITSIDRDLLAEHKGMPDKLLGEYDEMLGKIPGRWGDREFEALYGRTVDPQTGRIGDTGFEGAIPARDRIMAMFEGMGQQERADIQQQYRNLQSQVQGDVASRGLAGSTVLPSLKRGVATAERADLGRLDERLRRERIGAETDWSKYLTGLMTGLRGETLGADERIKGGRYDVFSGATAESLGQQERLMKDPLDYEYRSFKDMLGLLGGTFYQGPDLNAATRQASMTGYSLGPRPDIPEPNFLGTAGPGIASGLIQSIPSWLALGG